jgi:hypothetical protein
MILNFKSFLSEANMLGSIGTEKKGLRHVRNYLMPYLSDEQRQKVLQNFGSHIDASKIPAGNGDMFDPSSEFTHTLGTATNGHPAGTHVKVTGARVDNNGDIHVQTKKHGEIPMSKLNKPGDKKPINYGKEGFNTEEKVATNLGGKPAGSTGSAYDYTYGNGNVNGKVRKLDSDTPVIKGESKQNKAKMGESSIKWDPGTKKWGFTNAKLAPHYSSTLVNGKPILDHLNDAFPDGNARSFTTEAPKGTARAYLSNLGVNSLHLHRVAKATKRKEAIDHGTTYTIGDDNELAGKTNLGHLSNDDLDRLDGKIKLEAGGPGSIKFVHQPNQAAFREYADRSRTNEGHADLSNSEHANAFKQHVDNYLAAPKSKRVRGKASVDIAPLKPQQPAPQQPTTEPVVPVKRSGNDIAGKRI